MARSRRFVLPLVLATAVGCVFPDDRRGAPVHPDDPFPTFDVIRVAVSGEYAGVPLRGPAFDVRSLVARRAPRCATQTLSLSASTFTVEGVDLYFGVDVRFYEWEGLHEETIIAGGYFFGGASPEYRPPTVGAALVQLRAGRSTGSRSAHAADTTLTGRVDEVCDPLGDCVWRLRLDATLTFRGFNEESELRERADVVVEVDLEPTTHVPGEDGAPVLVNDARCAR